MRGAPPGLLGDSSGQSCCGSAGRAVGNATAAISAPSSGKFSMADLATTE